MRLLIGSLALLLLVGIVMVAVDWLKVEQGPTTTTFTVQKEKIKQDTDRAIDRGEQAARDATDAIRDTIKR